MIISSETLFTMFVLDELTKFLIAKVNCLLKVNGNGIEYKFPRIFTFRISTKGLTLLIAKIIVGRGEKPREEISKSNFSKRFSAFTFSPFFWSSLEMRPSQTFSFL